MEENVITIYKAFSKEKCIQIRSFNPFFKDTEYIIFRLFEDRVEITKPTLDYTGKMYKVYGKMPYGACFKSDVPVGKYEIDLEDSDEDCLVFYFQPR